jgi:hypothetical protein
MIENFEHYNVKLSDDLKPVVIWIDDLFAGRTKYDVPTKAKPLKAEVIMKAVRHIFDRPGFCSAQLRHIVNHLRQTGSAPILSNQKGYYTSQDQLEISSNVRSLEQRANGILNAANGLKRFVK